MAPSAVAWLADIVRTFNKVNDEPVAYKPFHNQLRKPAFTEFLRRILTEALSALTRPMLKATADSKVSRFRDIVVHDATSLALAAMLKRGLAHAAEHALGVGISTERVAKAARHFLDDILCAVVDSERELERAVHDAFLFIHVNARRAHPQRDRRTGRLAVGLCSVGSATRVGGRRGVGALGTERAARA